MSEMNGERLPPSVVIGEGRVAASDGSTSRLMKKPPTMSSRAQRGICFLFVFNTKQQMPRCARHDSCPFSSSCWTTVNTEQDVKYAAFVFVSSIDVPQFVDNPVI
jgi:hypothetical protein